MAFTRTEGRTSRRGAAALRVVACLVVLAVMGPSAARAATIHVEGKGACLEPRATRAALADVLARHPGAERATVAAVETVTEAGFRLVLRVVTPLGEVALERSFDVLPAECPSGPSLLSVALDTFLGRFPAMAWDGGVAAEPPAPPALAVRRVELVPYVSPGARPWPLGADLEAGLAVDFGAGRHRLATSLSARGALPQKLGGARFVDAFGALGLGWRYEARTWIARVEARTGAVLVTGYGFPESRAGWAPRLELDGSVLWRVGGLLVGPRGSVAPFVHDVVAEGAERTSLPPVRLGLVVGLPLGQRAR